MKQGSNGKGRPRGGRNNNQQPKGRGPSRNQTFDSNGPGVRVRGNAHQVVEKYQALARDASASGDRVLMENYLQHAEHYYRIILAQNQNNPVKAQRLDQGNALIGDADDYEDDGAQSDQPSVRYTQSEPPKVAEASQEQGRGDVSSDDGASSTEDTADDDTATQEKKPRRRSRSTRAREAGEAERRDRDGQADTSDAAPAAVEPPQSPAELAAAVTEREKKTRAPRKKAAPAAAESSADVQDLAEDAPKKPVRRRRTRATSDDADSKEKEVANG